MASTIAQLIKLLNHPVAIVQADNCPDKALQFKPSRWDWAIAMLAAANGKIAAFTAETTIICSYGLSIVRRQRRHKVRTLQKNPDKARDFICNVSNALIEKIRREKNSFCSSRSTRSPKRPT